MAGRDGDSDVAHDPVAHLVQLGGDVIRWLFLILLLPSLTYGQVEVLSFDPPVKQGVVVGGNYSPADVAKAKEVLAATEAKELKLKDDEFELIEPTKNAKDPLQFQSLTNKVHQLIRVKPNVPFAIWGKRRGEPIAKVHEFEAKPYEWGIIHAIAKANGSEILVANRNGRNRDTDPPEEVDRVKVVVGAVKPDDPPGPNPDDPKPPMPGEGFRVLIVRETADLANLTPQQVAIFTAKDVRDYLNSKTVLEGNQRAYRIWDKDTDVSREATHWKEAMARPRTTLPWVLVSNGKDGYEGPLPKNVDEMMALLRKYGEGK